MIAEADQAGDGEEADGEIDFVEFCTLMAKRMKDSEPDEEMQEVFNLFDKDGDGIIDYKDLKEVFVELGTEVSLEDCQLLIELHDLNGDN